MDAKLINVVKAFTLTIVRDGQLVKLRIEAGIQRLEDDIAGHWYTRAHSEPVPDGVKKTDAEVEAEAAAKAAADALAAEEAAAAEQESAAEAAAKAARKK
jgi:hypothetical protein